MKKKILIVEDESMIALDLKLILTKAGYHVSGIANSVSEALTIIDHSEPEMVLLDIYLKGAKTGIDLALKLTEKNIAFVYLSANFQASILEKAKETQPYGFLVKPFREKELLITLDVAFYRHQNSQEASIKREEKLGGIFDSIAQSEGDCDQKLLRLTSSLQPYIPFDYFETVFHDAPGKPTEFKSFNRTGFNEYQLVGLEQLANISNSAYDTLAKQLNENLFTAKNEYLNGNDFTADSQRDAFKKLLSQTFRLQSALTFPISLPNGSVVSLTFYSRKDVNYGPEHLAILNRLYRQMSRALQNVFSSNCNQDDVKSNEFYKPDRVAENKTVFTGFVGKSHHMLGVKDMIAVVAPTDTSVLILGESGTGKERVAKSIHELSPRRTKPLIIVNCASLPANLIESELFGHEKGAFTGAIDKRIGKFEQADKGTIFLDEIGEMPAELQVKLLRVLQEQEIERIGGKGTIKVDVRIIAATNRNLEREVESGRFRLDLYYRLYVFPITVPPLRDRKDDIPMLTDHFVKKYAAKTGKHITGVSSTVLNQLSAYQWPGNVRELEHLIERNVLLSQGEVISEVFMPKHPFNLSDGETADSRAKTIDENEREHIIAILKQCKGKISGSGGAAEILDILPTTLHSRIKKLGIDKESI